MALDALGIKQAELARRLGIKPQQLHQVVSGERPGTTLLDAIAQALKVDVLWLRTGADSLAPPWAKIGPLLGENSPLSLVGVVKAGDGDLTEYEERPSTPLPLKASWRVVQVQGWSAYPVVYPDQFVIIDGERAARPDLMTEAQRDDLHDNIVICQVVGGRAYLKRFCHAPGAPGGFIMASIDSGRGSPYVDPHEIMIIEPVVGVIFEDPTKPRKKRGKLVRKD